MSNDKKLYLIRVDYCAGEVSGPSSEYFLTVGKDSKEVRRFHDQTWLNSHSVRSGGAIGNVKEISDVFGIDGEHVRLVLKAQGTYHPLKGLVDRMMLPRAKE